MTLSVLCSSVRSDWIAAGPLVVGLGSSKALLITSASVVVPTALALLAPGVRGMRMPDTKPEAILVAPAPVVVAG